MAIVIMVFGSGCMGERNEGSSGETQRQEAKLTENNQQRLIASNPPPQLSKSLERENLVRRLKLLNDNDKVFYVYLVNYGKVMAFYTAKGKISSVNSKLTTGEQIVESPFYYSGGGDRGKVVESPALDGSYGTNGDAIFFFTTEGAYVEWAGDYMLSDFPLELSTPPELVRDITDKK